MPHTLIRASAGTSLALALLVTGAPTGAAIPDAKAAPSRNHVRSVNLPLQGSLNGCGANETIDVTGTAHVVAQTHADRRGTTLSIRTNLAGTTGTGETTGGTYQFTGAG